MVRTALSWVGIALFEIGWLKSASQELSNSAPPPTTLQWVALKRLHHLPQRKTKDSGRDASYSYC